MPVVIEDPAILVSFVFLKPFLQNRRKVFYRHWAMDSGAFSALSRGTEIDLGEYIDTCLEQMESKDPPRFIFSLDVIGDPEKSARNAETMTAQGVPVIPTFHFRSAWHYLEALAKDYPKIALGGMAARGEKGKGSLVDWKTKLYFSEQSFARVWPKWVHGFGLTDSRVILKVPFASVDSTSWFFGVRQYGRIQGFNVRSPMVQENREVSKSGTRLALEGFLELEKDVRSKLCRQLLKVTDEPFQLHLATTASGEELSYLGNSNEDI